MTLAPDALLAALARQPTLAGPRRFVVAFSGGVDSTVLLDLARRALPRVPGASLCALHVDHGWHEHAPRWAAHCAEQARRLGVRYEARRIDGGTVPGTSREAAARAARYAALSASMDTGDVLLTAHHADDQLETVLLQLARGAGPAGLAAMPEVAALGRGWHWRPLLTTARAAIEGYADEAGLETLRDPANSDPRYDRSYLRAQVVPALRERWPAIAAAAGRSARHCAAAAALLDELARTDLAHGADQHGRLDRRALATLPAARQSNLLRLWLAQRGLPTPSAAHMERLQQDLAARPDAAPCVAWPGAEVRRYRDRLYAMRPLAPVAADWRGDISPGRKLALPGGLGVLELQPTTGAGIARRHADAGLQVTFRHGGENIRLAGAARSRSLRNLYQEHGVVPWMRSRIPYLRAGDALAAVGDLWYAHGCAAGPGEEGVLITWHDRPPLY